MIDELQIITGVNIPVPELGLTLRQPKIFEISMLSEQNYFIALQLFRMSKENLKVNREEVTDWSIFQEALTQKLEGVDNPRMLISNFLQLFLIEKMTLGPRSIILDGADGIKNIEPEQFSLFRKYICEIGGESLLVPAEEQFRPKNKRAAEIAEKMKKARKRLAAQNPKPKNNKGFLSKYVRGVATVTANSLEQVNNMTILQLNNLMHQYFAWESYDLEVRSRLAGAKGDDKLVHWTSREIGPENDSLVTI